MSLLTPVSLADVRGLNVDGLPGQRVIEILRGLKLRVPNLPGIKRHTDETIQKLGSEIGRELLRDIVALANNME